MPSSSFVLPKESSTMSVTGRVAKECMPCFLSPLGFHLTAAIKEKIWREEFIDLNLILPPSRELYKYDRKEEKADDECCIPVIK